MKGTEHEEFILVAEFHEQLGPDPILLIPETPDGTSKFDQNSFAVHLLSKDLQNTSRFEFCNICGSCLCLTSAVLFFTKWF
jgi:hypothetical protein